MPTLPIPSHILLTGSNGYLGSWVLHILLHRGYSVRAAVRSLDKAQPLQAHFAKYVKEKKLEFVVVEDVEMEGAFDEAVKGVNGVLHLASPLPGPGLNPQEIIDPAVRGTLSLLRSASLPSASTIKRVVLTGSTSAIRNVTTSGVFDESSWSDAPALVEEATRNGTLSAVSPHVVYSASKALAEKAAWEFWENEKGKEGGVGWDLAVLTPPFIYGPPLLGADDPSTYSGTLAIWYNTVVIGTNDANGRKEQLSMSGSWVDVRDIAMAHALALEKEDAGGQRVIISAGSFIWQEWVNVAHKLSSPELPIDEGFPELAEEKKYHSVYDTSREQRLFGIKYRSMEETSKDIIEGATKGLRRTSLN